MLPRLKKFRQYPSSASPCSFSVPSHPRCVSPVYSLQLGKDVKELAEEYNVKIFTADIIYHLFDQFTAYMKQIRAAEQEAARFDVRTGSVGPGTVQTDSRCLDDCLTKVMQEHWQDRGSSECHIALSQYIGTL